MLRFTKAFKAGLKILFPAIFLVLIYSIVGLLTFAGKNIINVGA